MSLGFYPVFEREFTRTKFDGLGEVLVANVEALDEIARSAKLTLFTAFADNRPVPEDFDGGPDDLAEVMGQWTEWFNSADGRAAIQSIADHIMSHPEAAQRLEGASAVVDELEEMARVLRVAASERVRSRLQMS
jgi:hypothetical protein